jgi:hypothetical protein
MTIKSAFRKLQVHIHSMFKILFTALFLLGCGSDNDGKGSTEESNSDFIEQDSLFISTKGESEKLIQLAQQSVDIEATLKKSGIKLKDNTLPPEQQSKIDQALEEKRRSSFLNGKKPEEAIRLYEQFLKSFNASRSADLDQMAKWANDYWHSTYKSELEWYRLKAEEIEESLGY